MEEYIQEIYENIEKYYTDKILKYGANPLGVDWKNEEGQILRFGQLSKVLNINIPFTVADLGCGYGKFIDYLDKNFQNYTYIGYDLSNSMIKKAIELYGYKNNVYFQHIKSTKEIQSVDYIITSGIFNVKMHYTEVQWLNYILNTLEQMYNKSLKGFAFNILSKYSDKEYMRDYLYYADPLFLFDFCKRNFSKNVSLLHDYELYEFTIIVRKVV